MEKCTVATRRVGDLLDSASQLAEQGRIEEALGNLDLIVQHYPELAEVHFNRGHALWALGRHEEAMSAVGEAITKDPSNPTFYSRRAAMLIDLGRYNDAVADCDRAIALQPGLIEPVANRALALTRLFRFTEATEAFHTAKVLNPDHPTIHWNESHLRLLTGDFEQGWRKYEWRWKIDFMQPFIRKFTQPLWLGNENISGTKILLHAEQGLGDAIQFCRYAQYVAARGATVFLEIHPELAPILRDLNGVTALYVKGEELPIFDYHCPLLSLPLALGTRIETIPAGAAYITENPDKVVRWSTRFTAPSKMRIGLMWSGAPWNTNDRWRSIALSTLLSAMPSNVELISLQKEVRKEDCEQLSISEIKNFANQIQDFSDTAAIISLLDLVVSVDTSVAHLAAAMGKPTWLLLPHFPDWRWLVDRSDSPWYPTMRLFRQPQLGDWNSVMSMVRHMLQDIVDNF